MSERACRAPDAPVPAPRRSLPARCSETPEPAFGFDRNQCSDSAGILTRGATIRSHLIAVAARIARRGRGEITLHLPEGWHAGQEWLSLFEAACGPPRARAA